MIRALLAGAFLGVAGLGQKCLRRPDSRKTLASDPWR